MNRTTYINGRTVTYDLVRKNVRNLGIRIKTEEGKTVVRVTVPYGTPDRCAEDFVRANARFVLNGIEKNEKRIRELKRIEEEKNAESPVIMLLGRRCTVNFGYGNDYGYTVSGDGASMTVYLPGRNYSAGKALQKIQEQICEWKVREYSEKLYPYFREKGVDFPEISFRYLKSMWGCCRAKEHKLSFSYYLSTVPETCIECVVAHEFTHFLVNGHGKDFYEVLDALIPDRPSRDKLLREYSVYTQSL